MHKTQIPVIPEVPNHQGITGKTAQVCGRLISIAAMLFLVNSCTPRYIVSPRLPDFQSQKTDYSGMNLYVTSFKVLKYSSIDNPADGMILTSMFIDYIKSRNSFNNVYDATFLFTPEKSIPYVTMDVEMEPVLIKHRTWVLDVLAVYPGATLLPIPAPIWGTVNVKMNVKVKDRNGVIISSFSNECPQNYMKIFYTLYMAAKFEKAFSESYTRLFAKVGDALAQNRSGILAAAGKSDATTTETRGNEGAADSAIIHENQKPPLLSTIYANECFHTSFMNVGATVGGALLPIAGGVAQNINYTTAKAAIQSSNDPGTRTNEINAFRNNADEINRSVNVGEDVLTMIDEVKKRREGNKFEKKLGDFNVLTCLYASIDSLKGAIKHFDLSFATGIKESESINKNFAANDKSGSGTPYNSVSTNAKYQYISSFKVQYGMGARAGMEQFGLIKKYRPYIRLIGAIKDTKSNNVVWQNKIIVFGDAYLGSKAAKNVSGAELQNDFVVLCNQLAGILINDINGDSKFNGTQEMVDWLP